MKKAILATLILSTVLAVACKPSEWLSDDDVMVAPREILPPEREWKGESTKLIADEDDIWATPAELSGFEATPDYTETIAWLRRIESSTPEVELVSIGSSALGRDIWMAVICDGAAGDATTLRKRGKPTVLLQAGIHSGEIDGKDAGLMLLRDIVDKRHGAGDILDRVNILFVPIFNVDGHELVTSHSRINQRGPSNAGWRATAQRLNLNRDYMKADTPEMRAMLAAIEEWTPDLYVDLHVTDGADVQYDITFGHAPDRLWSPSISRWMDSVLSPAMYEGLTTNGHKPGPLFFTIKDGDWSAGVWGWTPTPRFSDGYGSARHLPSLLVENHSLKPYRQRVLGTRVLLESILRSVGSNTDSLREAISSDRSARPDTIPLAFKPPKSPSGETITLDVIEAKRVPSMVTGTTVVTYTGKPLTLEVPIVESTRAAASVDRPIAYWIPPTHQDVIDRLQLHGIDVETMKVPMTVEVEMYRLIDPGFATPGAWETNPFEGRARISAAVKLEKRTETFPPGSVRVPTDQPGGTLAILLLEPESPDSFFQWGFFTESLNRVEYFEDYAVEPLARQMLAASPELQAEFENKLASDESFKNDPDARLRWFYERSPYFDERWKLYPVARER